MKGLEPPRFSAVASKTTVPSNYTTLAINSNSNSIKWSRWESNPPSLIANQSRHPWNMPPRNLLSKQRLT